MPKDLVRTARGLRKWKKRIERDHHHFVIIEVRIVMQAHLATGARIAFNLNGELIGFEDCGSDDDCGIAFLDVDREDDGRTLFVMKPEQDGLSFFHHVPPFCG
jgi:hypothetical protein